MDKVFPITEDKFHPIRHTTCWIMIFNRPGVAGAVLQIPA